MGVSNEKFKFSMAEVKGVGEVKSRWDWAVGLILKVRGAEEESSVEDVQENWDGKWS